MKWTIEEPEPNPFEAVAGDETPYRVRHATVSKTDDASVGKAVALVTQETFRLAPENLDKSRSVVLFTWDSVYSTLTVTFTDAKKQRDATDVLKLFCTGWDRQFTKAKDEFMAELRAMEREDLVREWLDVAARAAKPFYAQILPKRKITFGFTTPTKRGMKRLGEPKKAKSRRKR